LRRPADLERPVDALIGHGVTTVVTGNCGVGLAPFQPGDHEALIGLIPSVEDIPEVVMAEHLDWSWQSHP